MKPADHDAVVSRPVLSIVVPVYNERAVLPLFLARMRRVFKTLPRSTELVFVDDGSEDGSDTFLISALRCQCNIRLVRLSRNFGKEAAMTAGIEHARGKAVVILDADLQDPPELIPDMVRHWQSGADVVLMQRRTRAGENWLKRASAYCFYRLLNRTSRAPIPVDAGDFRLMSRRAVDALLQLPERNRYMKGLFAWVGLPTVVLSYDRPARPAGHSKWDLIGLVGLALEGLTSFTIAPLRWATVMGVLAASAGTIFGLWIVVKAAILGDPTAGYPSLVAVITFLGGIQLMGLGILGEYVGKTYLEAKQRPVYLTRDVIEHCAAEPIRADPDGQVATSCVEAR